MHGCWGVQRREQRAQGDVVGEGGGEAYGGAAAKEVQWSKGLGEGLSPGEIAAARKVLTAL